MSEDLVVNINPSSFVRYVNFMYNDGTSTVYKHSPVTSDKCYVWGTEYLADPPTKDPQRPGYRFDGWYVDSECKTPYTKATYHIFMGEERTMPVYAKWIEDPSVLPGVQMVKITLQPVEGLRFDYDGLVIQKGTDFTYSATTFNNYHYDLTNAVSTRINEPVVVLDKAGSGVKPIFTLKSVDIDSIVVLSGAVRTYNINTDLHDVRITPYTSPTSGSIQLTLSLPEKSIYHNIEASVWMGGVNVTGNVLSNDVITIGDINGDVYIFAYADTRGYDVTISANNASYGTVDPTLIEGVVDGTRVSSIGNTLTIGDATVKATPASGYKFVGWSMSSGTITGNTAITANFEKSDAGIPWWAYLAAAAAAIMALLLVLLFLFRGKKSIVLSSNDSSYSAVSSKDFDGTTLQFIETSAGKEIMPVYAYLHRKDAYNRHDYLFHSPDLPQGLVISEEGALTGALTEEIAPGEARPFHIVAVKKPDENENENGEQNKDVTQMKAVCTSEFRIVVKPKD